MRRYFLLFTLCLLAFTASARGNNLHDSSTQQEDSVSLEIGGTARYKLYPTTNTWNFIRLDTRTGKMRLVQFSLESGKRFTYNLSDTDLTWSDDDAINGRFALYATKNIYNFILLDRIDGRTWQVQWSFEPENCGVIRIY